MFLATDETERKSVIGTDNLVCEIPVYTHVCYSNEYNDRIEFEYLLYFQPFSLLVSHCDNLNNPNSRHHCHNTVNISES